MLQPEQILHDRYQLKQKLGQSPGRQTWQAEDLAVQPPELVVVKLLAFGESMQWDDLKLFEREAQVLQQLNLPQIPKYRDSFSLDDRQDWFGLVQQYIPGTSLKQQLLNGKHFTAQQVRQIATNLLHVLIYLHELSPPVLHRDIKPSNLIWGEDHYIYLVDFGAVQDKSSSEGATFTVVGTYGYTPMEQFGGRAVAASDLYALGATLIHLLTGVAPADLPQVNLRIQFADRVSLDAAFVEWIEQMTDPDVMKRFQTARQALAALRSLDEQAESEPRSPKSALPSHYHHRHDRHPDYRHPDYRHPEPHPERERYLAPDQERVPLPQPWTPEQWTSSPLGTGVELHQDNESLLIKVSNFRPWDWLLVILLAIVALFVLPAIPLVTAVLSFRADFWIFALLISFLIGLFTYWGVLPTFVQFTQDSFSIYKLPFGVSISIVRGSIGEIHDVFHTLKTFRSGKHTYTKRVVILQTPSGEHYFGDRLSWEECSWLVQIIQDWIRLGR
jgi:serine/threonine protein kinase